MGSVGSYYRRLWSIFKCGPTNFSWLCYSIAGSGRPMSVDDLKWMKEQGVTSLLSLTEKPLSEKMISLSCLTGFHVPLIDHMPPSIDQINKSVGILLDTLNKGESMAVHCEAGKGRTGTILGCFLMKHDGLSSDESISFIRKIRPGSIESSQEKSLHAYQNYLNMNK